MVLQRIYPSDQRTEVTARPLQRTNPSNTTTPNTQSMMRPNPPQHRLQRRVIVKPVPSLLVRYAESVYDPLVRNGRHFLQGTHLTVSKCHPGRGGFCAWSQGAARKRQVGAITFLRAVSAWRRACSWPFCGLRPCRMDWRRWTHLMAAAARRTIFWAWKRRALASVITLCGLVSMEGGKGWAR